jgi:hypothetical protein
MFFQNIVKRKKKLGATVGRRRVGIASASGGCTAGAPHRAVSAPLPMTILGPPMKMFLQGYRYKYRDVT